MSTSKILRSVMALILMMSLLPTTTSKAQDFDQYFEDNTLRIDYLFAGNAKDQHIYVDQLYKQAPWAGRRNRLSEKFLNGNGQLTVRDHATQEVIYVWTFSTLFQEWQQQEEARHVDRAFESSYNIPFPKAPIDVTVTLTDNHQVVRASLTHTIDPKDILIRQLGDNGIPFKYIWRGRDTLNIAECVDVAILAEGYTVAEMDKFYHDCERATEALFTWEPFRSLKNRFNIVAVASPSLQSGPSVPRNEVWNATPSRSHYDTFYSDRYLTSQEMHAIYDQLSGVPFEHIMVLVNSELYGGGGIYNQVTLATSDHPTFREVFVHEFGHSYGGLGDEYAYGEQAEDFYPADTEPWEPNLTTLKDFDSKWKDLMPAGQAIPTPLDPNVPNYREVKKDDVEGRARLNACTQVVGVFEGAGYMTKGCYRPAQECRMKINEVDDFCPVCARAIRQITDFYTAK